jgi:hypothetical protein
LSNALDDAQSVGRVLAAMERARTSSRRKPAPPARRKEPTMPRNADLEDEYSRMPARPPNDETLAWSRRIKDNPHALGGVGAVDPAGDELAEARPYGVGFDRHGRQLPNTASPVADEATLTRYRYAQ